MSHIDRIRRLASVTDEEAAHMVSPQTKNDLAEHIMTTVSEQAPERRRRLLYLGVPLATATAAAVAAAVAFSGSPGSPGQTTARNGPARVELAALSFSTQGKYLVVKVKDPLADPARYKREFAAHGMNINLRLVPASPSVVGTVVESELPPSAITVPAKGECFSGGACPIGVKIPLTFHGSGMVTFGRAARPGEAYTATNNAFAPGEDLHCVDVRGRTVDETLAILKRHKVSAALFNYDSRPGYAENTPDREKIPGTWYVKSAEPYAPGQVTLFVQKGKPSHPEDAAYYRKLRTGCHP